MHDSVNLEKNDIPTVALITKPFRESVANVASACGIPNYNFVVIPHPVSSLNEHEIDEMVGRHFTEILNLLLTQSYPKTRQP
jgi:hypothetical protein